jgi:hypothetical protein
MPRVRSGQQEGIDQAHHAPAGNALHVRALLLVQVEYLGASRFPELLRLALGAQPSMVTHKADCFVINSHCANMHELV